MKVDKQRLLIFSVSFLLPLLYFRTLFLFLPDDYISPLRRLIGLNLHHFHFGIIILTIATLLLLFYKINTFSVTLSGLGLGLIIDSFFPSLFIETIRENELLVYFQHLPDTLALFAIILVLAMSISTISNKTKRTK